MKALLRSCCVGLLALAAPAVQAREAPRVGEAFGPLVLPTVDGRQVIDITSFRGRKVLLIEFASW